MKRLALLALLLAGCYWPSPVVPVPVPPPQPPPGPVEPSPDVEAVLAPWRAVVVGADAAKALEGLPAPDHTAVVGDVTIYAWITPARRKSGGFVAYEISVVGGKVTQSRPW